MQRSLTHTHFRKQKHPTPAGIGLVGQIGNWITGLQGNKNPNIIRHIETDGRRKKIINKYEDLFKDNHTIKDLIIDIQVKKDTKPIQQKGRPVPIHFRKTVKHELENLIEKGHLEKTDGNVFHLTGRYHHKKGQIRENST